VFCAKKIATKYYAYPNLLQSYLSAKLLKCHWKVATLIIKLLKKLPAAGAVLRNRLGDILIKPLQTQQEILIWSQFNKFFNYSTRTVYSFKFLISHDWSCMKKYIITYVQEFVYSKLYVQKFINDVTALLNWRQETSPLRNVANQAVLMLSCFVSD
jgi:hypothetical protein